MPWRWIVDPGGNVPSPRLSNTDTVFALACRRDVQWAVAVQVGKGDRNGHAPDSVVDAGLELPVAAVRVHRDAVHVRLVVCGHQICLGRLRSGRRSPHLRGLGAAYVHALREATVATVDQDGDVVGVRGRQVRPAVFVDVARWRQHLARCTRPVRACGRRMAAAAVQRKQRRRRLEPGGGRSEPVRRCRCLPSTFRSPIAIPSRCRRYPSSFPLRYRPGLANDGSSPTSALAYE